MITRIDFGAGTFNWTNVVGERVYPRVSGTAAVEAVNWGTNVAGAGLTNLGRGPMDEAASAFPSFARDHFPSNNPDRSRETAVTSIRNDLVGCRNGCGHIGSNLPRKRFLPVNGTSPSRHANQPSGLA